MYCIIVQTQLKVQMSTLASQTLEKQHHGGKLASENKSLEAQLGFASQKLHDMEKRKNSRAASPPPLSHQSSSVSSFAPHMLSSYELQTNEEEFYIRLQDEFDNTVCSIPFEFDDPPTDNCIAEDSFRSLSKPIMKTNPRRATLAVPSFSSSHWHSSPTAIREDEKENDGEDSCRVRINELKRGNAKALMEASFSQVMSQKKYMCLYSNIWPMSCSVQRDVYIVAHARPKFVCLFIPYVMT